MAMVHGLSEWLMAPFDFDGVAAAVAGLLASDEQRARMGRRAREGAVQQRGPDECVVRSSELSMRPAARPAMARAGRGA